MQANQSNDFYNVRGIWSYEMINKLGESQAVNTVMAHNLESALSLNNPWRLRPIKEHVNYQQIAGQGKLIHETLTG